jgi:putative acetyltransferase
MEHKGGAEVIVRAAVATDAAGIIEVHHAAVHQTASSWYPPEILDNWSRQPDEGRYQQMRNVIADGDELVLVAEDVSGVCGFGAIVPRLSELRAVYVRPSVGRRGIGSGILASLEQLALDRGVSELQLDASINAETFYVRAGYEILSRGVHRLRSGHEMACIRMKKSLTHESQQPEWSRM